ncbi:MAG: hypothetical protein CME26_16670 [Gemmatimonadetes bacterium]|nr:hypothetical protein [Gemmatimonadota bacterium]
MAFLVTPLYGETGPDLSRNGILRYNRVEGLFAGYRLHLSPRKHRKISFRVQGGYGFSLQQARWEMGVFYTGRKTDFSLTAFDRTHTNDESIIRTGENTFNALLFKGDYRDYFRAKNGFSFSGLYRLRKNLRVQGNLTISTHSSMPVQVGWSLYRNSDAFRPNPAVREGDVGHVKLAIVYDDRRKGPVFRNGTFLGLTYERGFREFPFDGFQFAANRRQKTIFGKQAFILRFLAGSRESIDEQLLFDLGGVSTLRGYRIKEYTGNRVLLLNIDYLFNGDLFRKVPIKGAHLAELILFADAGWTGRSLRSDHLFKGFGSFRFGDLKTNVGAALSLYRQLIRLNFARRFEGDIDDWTLSLRFRREL